MLNTWQLALFTFFWNLALAHLILLISYVLKKKDVFLEGASFLLFLMALLYGIILQQITRIQILYPHYYCEIGAFSLMFLTPKSLKYYYMGIALLALAAVLEFLIKVY